MEKCEKEEHGAAVQPENLAATPTIDWTDTRVRDFVERHVTPTMTVREKAVALYYAVRDTIRYDPYRIDLSIAGMKASTTLRQGYGWCVPKAVLLAACCRGCAIPARLGFGDVKNHMTSRRLQEQMQTDIFYWHGFTEIFLDGRWLKATPAFNLSLCDKLGIAPLDFDGHADSIFHAFDRQGNRSMEYLRQRGSFADLPLAEILNTFSRWYPGLLTTLDGDFEQEAANEST